MPFDKIIDFVNSPIFKLLIFFLILLLSEFSLIQPISPPILPDSEKLYVAALFSKPMSFILLTISLYFFSISSLLATSKIISDNRYSFDLIFPFFKISFFIFASLITTLEEYFFIISSFHKASIVIFFQYQLFLNYNLLSIFQIRLLILDLILSKYFSIKVQSSLYLILFL